MTTTNVATTTLQQINALDFWARARWGVRAAQSNGNELRLDIGAGRKLIVALDPSDTYTVTLWKTPRATRKALLNGTAFVPVQLGEMSFVYADSLVRVVDALLAKAGV